MITKNQFGDLVPSWTVPKKIHAVTTCRRTNFNLALHVNDDPEQVMARRLQLIDDYHLPQAPHWLDQIHSPEVIQLDKHSHFKLPPKADASFTYATHVVCAVMTADCLPILLYDRQKHGVAAIHGGWRGLLGGIIENTLKAMQANPMHVQAWLGPAICQACYPVGAELKTLFCEKNPAYSSAFAKINTKILLDISKIAEINLTQLGVQHIDSSNCCTVELTQDFFSYRRDSKKSGRMATFIWISQD
jgi:hypothetical protein